MARSAMPAVVGGLSADVSVVDFLAHREPVPYLNDLAPHMDPAAFQTEAGWAPGAPVYDLMRTRGGPQSDVRLLIPDGEHHLGLATALARQLRCDVYLTPEGAEVRYVREAGPVGAESWDAIAIDRATGDPTRWLVVRPVDLPADVPTWFTTVRGRLRPSHGLVTVTLPDGLAFATKSTFRDTVDLAASIRASLSPMTTLAVTCDTGKFQISRFDDAGTPLDGVEFATLVSASLDVIHPDVQLALTWPADPSASVALGGEIRRFADTLNRTVWVPRPHGAAFVLPGCGEFAAVDEVGSPSAWHAYPAHSATDWEPRYGTDEDGRLVPLGETVAAAFPGVRFVSVPRAQFERLRPWYESVAPCPDLFTLDLALLGDGRLGVIVNRGDPLAIGPRALREVLRGAGWRGEDLLLLTQPPAQYWTGAMQHLHTLANQLMVDIWFPALGAEVWARQDGTLAAAPPEGSEQAWLVATFGHAADVATVAELPTPPALTTVPRSALPSLRAAPAAAHLAAAPAAVPAAIPAAVPAAATLAAAAQAAVSLTTELPLVAAAAPGSAVPAGNLPGGGGPAGSAPAPADGDVIEPVAVTAPEALGSGRPHRIPWLPATPVVNQRAIDLYLWTPLTDDHIEAWGLPSADLFLVAGQDPLRLAERRRDGYLLRVSAPEGIAVDLFEHVGHAPPAVRQRLLESGSTHLLPLAWMSGVLVTARFDLDGRCGIAARTDIDGGVLAIRFDDADHGVPGLPNDVVHWPDKGQRTGVPSYLLLREDTALDQVVHRGYVALSRRKPPLEEGHCLIEVKVRKRKAIDIPATLDNLGELLVLGRLHDFVGLDLLLPENDLSQAAVSKIWRRGATGKPVVERPVGTTLFDTLSPEPRELAATAA